MYYLYYVIRVKHKTNRVMNITWLEDKTLSTFISCLYAEPGYSDVDVNDISEIVELDETFHILKITELNKFEAMSMEQMKESILFMRCVISNLNMAEVSPFTWIAFIWA